MSSVSLRYACPRSGCQWKVVRFRENSILTNLYCNLRSCFRKGKSEEEQNAILRQIYCDATQNPETNIRNYFVVELLSDYHKTVYFNLHFIELCNLSVTKVEAKEYYDSSKHDASIIYRRIVSVNSVSLSWWEKITKKLQRTVRSVSYDG